MTLSTDERLAALERRIADAEFAQDVYRVKLEQLVNQVQELQRQPKSALPDTLAKLMRKLEMVGNLDAGLLLQPGSITANLLHDELKAAA